MLYVDEWQRCGGMMLLSSVVCRYKTNRRRSTTPARRQNHDDDVWRLLWWWFLGFVVCVWVRWTSPLVVVTCVFNTVQQQFGIQIGRKMVPLISVYLPADRTQNG